MTNIDDVRDKLNSTIDEQADTIARLEMELAIARLELELAEARQELELAEARQENRQMARMLAEPSEVKADAEALRALAAWIEAEPGSGRVKWVGAYLDTLEVTLRNYERPPFDLRDVTGTGPTLAAAIMDALKLGTK